jgi:hypothetical protein
MVFLPAPVSVAGPGMKIGRTDRPVTCPIPAHSTRGNGRSTRSRGFPRSAASWHCRLRRRHDRRRIDAIWRSDWPVVNLAASHGEWLEIVRSPVPAKHRPQCSMPMRDGSTGCRLDDRAAEKGVKRRPTAPLRGNPPEPNLHTPEYVPRPVRRFPVVGQFRPADGFLRRELREIRARSRRSFPSHPLSFSDPRVRRRPRAFQARCIRGGIATGSLWPGILG